MLRPAASARGLAQTVADSKTHYPCHSTRRNSEARLRENSRGHPTRSFIDEGDLGNVVQKIGPTLGTPLVSNFLIVTNPFGKGSRNSMSPREYRDRLAFEHELI